MQSNFGKTIKTTIEGCSHGEFVSANVIGLPSGFAVDMTALSAFMKRRQGGGALTTPRSEADEPVFESGIVNGVLTGEPLRVKIFNKNTRSGDYKGFSDTPRPSHADYTAPLRFGNIDMRGGGHFSGRLTAPLCVVGGICKQILESKNVHTGSHLASVGNILDTNFNPISVSKSTFEKIQSADFPTIDQQKGQLIQDLILAVKDEGDSIGAVVECAIIGMPAGYGDPLFDGVENEISKAIFGLGGVRGIEFGLGFSASEMRGSEHNDPFCMSYGEIKTETNNCGGVLGGITNGMPILFKVAFKPTASIAREQRTVSVSKAEPTTLKIVGRHDPCIAIRALPCVEAIANIVLLDLIYRKDGVN